VIKITLKLALDLRFPLAVLRSWDLLYWYLDSLYIVDEGREGRLVTSRKKDQSRLYSCRLMTFESTFFEPGKSCVVSTQQVVVPGQGRNGGGQNKILRRIGRLSRFRQVMF